MKSYTYTTTTDVAAEKLYRAITDINRWPEWDRELEATTHDGKLTPGSPFTLKPKGGPKLAMEVVEANAPMRFDDLAHLPLAKLRMSHSFTPRTEGGTGIEIKIEVFGPLGFLWDRILARKLAAGAAEQTRAFIAYVRTS